MLKPDLPFARDDANRFLPWMIALMCAIAALMFSVGLTLGQWSAFQHGDLTNSFTVHVPNQGDKQDQVEKNVTALLGKTRGVQSVKPLSEAQVRKLVEPWLGSDSAMNALPMPAVFDIATNGAVDIEALKEQLTRIAADASVDTHKQWVEKFAKLSRAMQAGVFALAGCIVLALAGMMVFTARAAMKLHESSVMLLHMIGASDAYIAKQFQANALMLALRGAIPGTLVALLAYAGLGLYTAHLDAPLLPSFALSWLHWLMLLSLPGICAMIAVVSVRRATLKQLQRLP